MKLKQHQKAADDFDVALSILGDDAWTLVARARTLLSRGLSKAAIADATRAMKLEPGSAVAVATRAEARWLADGIPVNLVLDDCDRTLELNPGSTRVLAVRAFALLYLDRLQDAADELDRYTKIAPATDYMLFIQEIDNSLSLLQSKQFAEAILGFDRSLIALSNAFKDENSAGFRIQKASVLRLMALCHTSQGRLQDAGEKLAEATQTFPERSWSAN